MPKWGLIIILFIFVVGVASFLRPKTHRQSLATPTTTPSLIATTSAQTSPIPTPWPAPLIPSLRQENFQSQLVREKILEETTTYQTWLAHFTADSLTESGLLVIPKGEMPATGWPTIILVHGYAQPEAYRVNGTPYRHWWQAVVNQGQFAVFKPDLRGHDQSQGQAVSTYYDDGYVRDLLFAYRALQTDPLIDAHKIGLWSHSSAGNLVLRAAASAQNIPAISIWGGGIYTYEDFCAWGEADGSKIPNPDAWLAELETNNPSFYQLVNQHLQGDCQTNLEFWHAFAPTSYLDGITTTFQIQHARTDETINYVYAQNLNEILLAANLTVKFESYDQGDHNFNYILPAAIKAMTDFFSASLAPPPLIH